MLPSVCRWKLYIWTKLLMCWPYYLYIDILMIGILYIYYWMYGHYKLLNLNLFIRFLYYIDRPCAVYQYENLQMTLSSNHINISIDTFLQHWPLLSTASLILLMNQQHIQPLSAKPLKKEYVTIQYICLEARCLLVCLLTLHWLVATV